MKESKSNFVTITATQKPINAMNKEFESKMLEIELKTSQQLWIYGAQRLESIIITIASGGLYVCLEALKSIKTAGLSTEFSFLLLISGLMFVVSIATNAIGYYYSKKGFFSRTEWVARLMSLNAHGDKHESYNATAADAERLKAEHAQNATKVKRCNKIATLTLVIGLLCLLFWFFVIL